MKPNTPRFLSLTLGLFLLAGCCTARHRGWEYKVIEAGNANTAQSAEQTTALLNNEFRQGWAFIQADGGRLYFKRPTK